MWTLNVSVAALVSVELESRKIVMVSCWSKIHGVNLVKNVSNPNQNKLTAYAEDGNGIWQNTYRHPPLIGLVSDHQQVMNFFIVHLKVAHLHMTLDLEQINK